MCGKQGLTQVVPEKERVCVDCRLTEQEWEAKK
jgi:hypothetical protein